MYRLTKKKYLFEDTSIDNEYQFYDEDVSIFEIVDKLGQLEDIEEEYAKHGIDLMPLLQATLFKIKKSSDLEKTLKKELELTKVINYDRN